MEKYILELIEDNNRVIIPNFGAFIIAKEDGISILFNNFLSFNDGLLVNYIAEQEGIDTIAATDKVFDYVDNLKKELDDNGEFIIKNLGVFNKDKNGILRFQQADFGKPKGGAGSESEEKEIIILDTDKTPNEVAPSSETKEIEKKIEEDIKTEEAIKDPVLTIDNDDNEVKKETPQPVEKKVEIKAPSAIITTPKQEIKKPEAAKKTPSTTHQDKKTSASSQSKTVEAIKERKKRDIVTFIIIASIIIIALAIYLLFFSTPKNTKPQTTAPAKIAVVDSAEIKRQDSLRVAQELEQARLDSIRMAEEERMSIVGKFHLIVGSFKQEKNASNLAQKLQNKGYPNAQYFLHGKMYFVSVDNNKKYGAMEDLQQDILSKERMSSWIFKAK